MTSTPGSRALDAQVASADVGCRARAQADGEGEYQALRASLDGLRALAGAARRALAAYAAEVYRNNGSGAAAIGTLIDAENPSQVAVGNHYLEGLAGERDREVDRYQALRHEVERKQRQVVVKRDHARAARQAAEAEPRSWPGSLRAVGGPPRLPPAGRRAVEPRRDPGPQGAVRA